MLVLMLVAALAAESSLLASTYVNRLNVASTQQQLLVLQNSFVLQSNLFNQPISNDTERTLDSELDGSWMISIHSQLVPSASNLRGSEAEIAIAPEYPTENHSIPTLIVQERGDGLLRIEYFEQNWNNSYGLVLYNSTSPTWIDGENLTLNFLALAPPVQVNPQTAPYPNGNLTISVGNTVVLSNYPIAWAGLSDFYIYGLRGSSFTSGTITLTVYEIRSDP